MIIFKAKPEVFIDETLAKQVQQFISHDGNSDNDLYIGSTQLSVPNYGMIPVQFNLDAKNIVEAFEIHINRQTTWSIPDDYVVGNVSDTVINILIGKS